MERYWVVSATILKTKKTLTAFVTFSLFWLFLLASQAPCQRVQDYIDTKGLTKTGDDWDLIYEGIEAREGHIKLHHDKWLMYFLHWRPLTEEKKKLTLEYVRDHMMNFWGESFNFELNNIEGEVEIAGHKGFFTDGTFYEGVVYSRFIVWNCPHTNRQFTADCNINMRRGTPRELLELQRLVTKTVCCHSGAPAQASPLLSQKYESPKWNLFFYIPDNWRTTEFEDKEWFPAGITVQNGSLWTLLTDSQKHLELLWEETEAELSSSLFCQFMSRLPADFSYPQGYASIFEVRLDSLDKKDGYYLGEGVYKYRQSRKDKSQISDYGFKALLWRNQKRVYFLLGSLIHVKEFWGIKNDLTPSARTLESYLKYEIIPNIKVFDKSY